jgi:D-sedoheptulose 7-phosphate isomerase
MISNEPLRAALQAHATVLQQTVEECGPAIIQISSLIVQCFQRGKKLILCGNGGSAADAQHIAAEFINRFRFDRPPLPAFALTTDTSVLTSIGNDSAFDCIFSRQIEAMAQPGDILAGISTSGRSSNVLRALEVARVQKVTTIGFTSTPGIQFMQSKCDLMLAVPSADTARIQEAHEFAWHYICGAVESELFPQ